MASFSSVVAQRMPIWSSLHVGLPHGWVLHHRWSGGRQRGHLVTNGRRAAIACGSRIAANGTEVPSACWPSSWITLLRQATWGCSVLWEGFRNSSLRTVRMISNRVPDETPMTSAWLVIMGLVWRSCCLECMPRVSSIVAATAVNSATPARR